MTTRDDGPWWANFYDEWLEQVLLDGSDAAEIDATVGFLTERLGVSPGGRIFDQCCGNGRLSLPLARAGFEVVGVDQAEAYIARATREADADELSASFEVADAFEYIAQPGCDAALNWWTSFGYAADDETNLRMLRRAFESLRPGGRFALDVFNVARELRHFQPAVIDRRQVSGGEVVLTRESQIDLAEGVMRKHWTYFLPDGRRVRHETRVRLYLPHRIGELLKQAGFVAIELYGGVDGSALTIESPRCILVARRPGDHP